MDKRMIFLLVGIVLVIGGTIAAVFLIPSSKKAPVPVSETNYVIPTTAPIVFPTLVPAKAATVSATPSPTSAIKTFTVEGADYSFSPSIIKVSLGSTVVINFKVKTGTHDFKIDEFDVATNQMGEEDEEQVEFVVNKKGSFEYYCSVGNHRTMGMVGKLVVE